MRKGQRTEPRVTTYTCDGVYTQHILSQSTPFASLSHGEPTNRISQTLIVYVKCGHLGYWRKGSLQEQHFCRCLHDSAPGALIQIDVAFLSHYALVLGLKITVVMPSMSPNHLSSHKDIRRNKSKIFCNVAILCVRGKKGTGL